MELARNGDGQSEMRSGGWMADPRRREATLHRELRKAARASQGQMWQVHGKSREPGRQSCVQERQLLGFRRGEGLGG